MAGLPPRSFIKPVFSSSSVSPESFDYLYWRRVADFSAGPIDSKLLQETEKIKDPSTRERIEFKLQQKKRDDKRKERIARAKQGKEYSKRITLRDLCKKAAIRDSHKMERFFPSLLKESPSLPEENGTSALESESVS